MRLSRVWYWACLVFTALWDVSVAAVVFNQYFVRNDFCWYGPQLLANGVDRCETYFWHWTNDSMWSAGPAFEFLLRTADFLLALIGVPLVLWLLAFGVSRAWAPAAEDNAGLWVDKAK